MDCPQSWQIPGEFDFPVSCSNYHHEDTCKAQCPTGYHLKSLPQDIEEEEERYHKDGHTCNDGTWENDNGEPSECVKYVTPILVCILLG